ncbi:hypothetical protein PsorP6_016834 [Peronosclerospora sorghi]|uniref:Uncharacterized protein n=1 Tax=Peronosclerospora sorghi TaxID=230839 RepID=A0ACC0WFX3_9STRA|nr:hypothetical protein PsorP6_016834 [Peronosclerospora sorghi]
MRLDAGYGVRFRPSRRVSAEKVAEAEDAAPTSIDDAVSSHASQCTTVRRLRTTRKKETIRSPKEKRIVKQLRQRIVYEDEHFVVLNKPEGLAVQVDSYKGIRQPSIASFD